MQASRLDPLSDAGLKAAATIAIHLGRPGQARPYLLAAVRREPTDGEAWQQLAFEDLSTGAMAEGRAAAQRARELDPEGASAVALAQDATATLAGLPAASATATVTPASVGGSLARRRRVRGRP